MATWSLRLRPARSLPPSAPSRSSSPRSSAVCTSSSATVGRNDPFAQARSRSSRALSIELSSASVSSPARCSTRACAREARRSYRASRQSNWTLTDSRASASAGPAPNRPPHSRVGPSTRRNRPDPLPPVPLLHSPSVYPTNASECSAASDSPDFLSHERLSSSRGRHQVTRSRDGTGAIIVGGWRGAGSRRPGRRRRPDPARSSGPCRRRPRCRGPTAGPRGR